jgi:hypothetical protein
MEGTSVTQLLSGENLPNPATPIPFEQFAIFKESDDLLDRCAFWAFYGAWCTEQHGTGETSATLAVEARHDGHCLRALSGQLLLRDAVLVRRDHLEALVASRRAVRGFPVWYSLTLFLGIALGILLLAGLLYLGGYTL